MPYLVLLLTLSLAACTAQAPLDIVRAPADDNSEPLAMPTAENTFLLDGPDYACSAFAINPRWAVTAAHCIIEGETPAIVGDGPRRLVTRALTHPAGRDVALVQVGRDFSSWFELSPFDAAEPGAKGYNGGFGCDGSLRSDQFVFGSDTTWTALNCAGDSGGPVLDSSGRAIGTLTHHEHGRSGQVGISLMQPLGDWRSWALDHLELDE